MRSCQTCAASTPRAISIFNGSDRRRHACLDVEPPCRRKPACLSPHLVKHVFLFSIPPPPCRNPSKHFPSELGEPTPGDGKAEVSHSDLLKIPWVVSRFVPVDQPREASAIFDYDVAWSEVMVCKDKVILGRHWSSTCFLMLLSRLAGLFAKGHEVVPEIDDGRDGGCRCVGWHTIVLLEPNGPADSSPEGPSCWPGECPHPPDHAAQLKGQAERRDDAEMGPDLHESPVQPPCCSVSQSPPPQPHTAYDTRQWIATGTPTSSAAMTSPSRSRRSTSPHRKTRRIRTTRTCSWRSPESAPSVST